MNNIIAILLAMNSLVVLRQLGTLSLYGKLFMKVLMLHELMLTNMQGMTIIRISVTLCS